MKIIAQTGPWLIALAPAWFVFDTLAAIYHVPPLVAGPIAAGVELTGVAAFHTFVRLYGWNKTKRKNDPAGPAGLAAGLVAGYALSGFVLTAVIKRDWTIGLFFALAIVGYANIALTIDQDERERSVAAAKAIAKKRGRSPGGAPSPVQPSARSSAGRTALPPSVPERQPDYEADLGVVHRQAAGRPFKRADVEGWTGRAKTSAVGLINYGLQTGQVHAVGRYTYATMNGHGGGHAAAPD